MRCWFNRLALATVLWMMTVVAAAGSDPLTLELRERVERLKSEVRMAPSSPANAKARALVFYDWLNAAALAGRYIPVEATRVVTHISAYGAPFYRELDAFILEFALHDEHPRAIGSLVLDGAEPHLARSLAEFKQTYTLGTAPMRAGGGVMVAKHFQSNHAPYQVTHPARDNYVSITSSNPRVRFAASSEMMAGMHGGFRGPEPALVFRLEGTDLGLGDTITVTYGDRRGGGAGLLMPDFASEAMPFPLYVDLDGENVWYSLPIQPVAVVGSEIRGVHGFAPSIVATGEVFDISIRAEDAYANRATGAVPNWKLLLNGKAYRDVRAATGAITIVDRIRLDEPGVYRFTMESVDGSIRGVTNPILAVREPRQRIFWGDTHGHSGFAEGIGSAEEFMRFARDDARLDFVTHSEHDIYLDAHEWEVLRQLVRDYRSEGRFAPYLGYEWTVRSNQGGHHNVLFRTPEDRSLVPGALYPTLSRLYQGLRERYDPRDIVVIPHAHNRADYRLSDPELQPLVEIMSQHGTFEWFGRMYLQHGHQVGFIAASDDHLSKPGYSIPWRETVAQMGGLGAVFAPAHSSDAIFDGMKALRTYATMGDRIILDFSVNDTPMGQRAPYSDERLVKGRVIGTTSIDNISIIKNDEVVWSRDYYASGGSLGKEARLALSFYSESHPKQPPDNPRGWRHWRGTLRVEGAELVAADLVDYVNRNTQSMRIDSDEPNLVHFSTGTRGDFSSLTLELKNIALEARILIRLDDATEVGAAPPLLRPHQMIPGGEFEIALAQMNDGRMSLPMPFDDFADRIDARLVARDAPDDVSFEYVDGGKVRHGDYYFVRVRQSNDAMAWSSPVWVGGNRPR